MFWAIQILKEVKNNKALHYLRCWQGPFHPTSQMWVYRKNACLSPFKHGENNVLQPSNGGFASQHFHRRRLNHLKNADLPRFFFVGLQTKPCLPWFFRVFPSFSPSFIISCRTWPATPSHPLLARAVRTTVAGFGVLLHRSSVQLSMALSESVTMAPG